MVGFVARECSTEGYKLAVDVTTTTTTTVLYVRAQLAEFFI